MKKRRLGLILASSIVVSSLLQNSLCTHAQNTVAETVKSLEGESVYQIMVDRFYDGDPSNNAKGEAFRYTENNQDDFRYMHGGDWQGVIDKIPYIKGMGYTAIWISPVADPQLWGMPDANGKQWPTAYHGYNVYDPNRANRYFGTDDPIQSKKKLKELVDECHKNGMKVILDVVPNHVGDYLQGQGTNAHYLNAFLSMKNGTQLQPVAPFNNINWYNNKGDIDFSNEHPHSDWKSAKIENHDLGGLDDLNYDNASAKQAMFQSIKSWFDYTGADAARVDAAKCMRPSDVHDLEEYIGVPTFGENFDMCPEYVSKWVGSNGETGMLDFPLFQSVVNDFGYGKNFDNTSEISLKSIFDKDYYYGNNVNEMVTFIDNHDRNRFLTEASGDVRKLKNALTFIYSCRGVPVVFQGTEQERGNANGSLINGIADTYNRWSMQTKDKQGNILHDYFNTDTGTYQTIAHLNKLRSKYSALRNGTQREMWSSPHLYAFSRRIDSGKEKGQELICAFNNSEQTQSANMQIRTESSILPGATLVNVDDPSDTVVVTSDGRVNISVLPQNNKIYTLKTQGEVNVSNFVDMTFTVRNATTTWGENIYLVGNCKELGNWNPDLAVGPGSCTNYPNWEVKVKLPKNKDIEFKAIKKDGSGHVVWESGSNHTLHVKQGQNNYSFDW